MKFSRYRFEPSRFGKLILPASFALLVLCAGAFAQDASEPAIPQAFSPSHYARLLQRSPFAPATAPVAEDVTPDFAANLYITGVAKIGTQDCVFIASKDQQQRYALFSGEPGPDGISLVSIQWATEASKSVVRIRKGSQEATIKFDEALIKAAGTSAVAEAQQETQNPNRNRIFPPRVPGNNRWGNGNRFNSNNGGNENNRRRVRIINNQ